MRLSSFITDPLGRSARYSYNADDQLTSTTDRDGRRTTFSYDSGGRETGEAWLTCSGGVLLAMTFTYDNMGRVTSADSPSALLTNTYDSGGNQLTAVTSGPGTGQPSVTLSSAYDGNNNRTSLADSISTANTIAYAYDIPGRMTTISTNVGTGSYSIAFAYDPAGNLSSIARKAPTSGGGSGNFTTTTFSYDAADRLTTIADGWVNSGSGGGSAALATYAYGYDNANRVTSETDKEGLVTLSYDSGGQLLTARGSRTENYSYDSGGNRNMTGYTTGTGNELTSGGGYTFTYDNEGNMTGETQLSTGDGWTFGYDNRNRMVAAEEKSSGGTILCQATYTYDAENRRIGEDVNGTQTWTAYDGVNPYADFNGAGTLQDRYLMGAAVDEVLGRIDASGGVAWYLTDRLGSVRDIVNTTGTVLDHIVYDSFGNIVTETNASNGDRFKFTGREYDAATGLYYYRARYYDPATGRFAEQDPIGFASGEANLYRLGGNAVTNAVDPSGETGSDVNPTGPVQEQFFEDMKKLMAEAMKAMADNQAITAQQYSDAMKNINKLNITGVHYDYTSAGGAVLYGNTNLGWLGLSGSPTTTLWADYYKVPNSFSFADLMETMLHESYHAGTGWWSFWEGSIPRGQYDKAQLWAEQMAAQLKAQARQQWDAMNQLLKDQAQAIAAEQAAIQKAIQEQQNQRYEGTQSGGKKYY